MSPQRSSFAPAVAFTLVLVGFIALIAWMALSAFEADFQSGADGGAHALSKSAVGYAGLVRLLNETGQPALAARGPVTSDEVTPGVMIVTIDGGDPSTPLMGLPTTEQFKGSVLMVLPKWSTAAMIHRGWVRKVGLREVDAETWLGPSEGDDKIELQHDETARSHLLTLQFPNRKPVQFRTGTIDSFQTFKTAPGFSPLVVDEAGDMVIGYIPKTAFIALSEPDLLNNHGIADLQTAKAGLSLIEALADGGPVFFDVTLNGFERPRSLLRTILMPPFLPATLCLLAAAMLVIWHAAFRFGAPARALRELALGKQALADNQAGLIRMARREASMGVRYADLIRTLAGRAVGAPRELAGAALDAFLDKLGARGRTKEPWSDVRAAADRVQSRHDLVEAAERLHRWRLEMTRERN